MPWTAGGGIGGVLTGLLEEVVQKAMGIMNLLLSWDQWILFFVLLIQLALAVVGWVVVIGVIQTIAEWVRRRERQEKARTELWRIMAQPFCEKPPYEDA